jgi:hypothetical protein
MKPAPNQLPLPGAERGPRLVAGLLGIIIGIALLKFGNPGILEKYTETPTNIWEFIFWSPWPIGWAYGMIAAAVVAGLFVFRWPKTAPKWLVILPAVWLGWQFIAGAQSLDARLTSPTLAHFVACVAWFYLGLLCLGRIKDLWPLWLGVLGGFTVVLISGWMQHFGGLEETRKHFFLYVYPTMKQVSPEHLKRVNSTRIFSTLFYPNALAGALLLLTPPLLGFIARSRARLAADARWFLVAVISLGVLGCLFWSGSKGGWLLMLLLGLVTLLRLPLPKSYKNALVAAVLLLGLTGFGLKYAGFFAKGATSVSARFEYWRAAAITVKDHPLLGSGPGTFYLAYEKVRRPEAEAARLVHNDYLEQASDSGLPGFAAYLAFIGGLLWWSYVRQPLKMGKSATEPAADRAWELYLVWLGVLGWALQGLMEFGLYLPSLSWPAFLLMGWLVAVTDRRAPVSSASATAPAP